MTTQCHPMLGRPSLNAEGGILRQQPLAAAAAITEQLTQAGYRDIRQKVLELQPVPAVCVLATKR